MLKITEISIFEYGVTIYGIFSARIFFNRKKFEICSFEHPTNVKFLTFFFLLPFSPVTAVVLSITWNMRNYSITYFITAKNSVIAITNKQEKNTDSKSVIKHKSEFISKPFEIESCFHFAV